MIIGQEVRVKDPDGYIESKARKLRNRVGVVVRFQQWSGRPIIRFRKEGRRQEFVCDFAACDLEVLG